MNQLSRPAGSLADLAMLSGFGNEFATEALPGALPAGQNSPQKVPYGLYAEQLSGTAFTVPRHDSRRTASAPAPGIRRSSGSTRGCWAARWPTRRRTGCAGTRCRSRTPRRISSPA